jgi:hypothetical protein
LVLNRLNFSTIVLEEKGVFSNKTVWSIFEVFSLKNCFELSQKLQRILNVGVSTVETDLQRYIDKNFEVITSIEDSLKLLRKFKAILKRENLKNGPNGLIAKYTLLFQNYGGEIQSVEDQYQRFKTMPPIVRNMPTVSGSITWSRHLFHRISGPMEQFPQDLIKSKESRKFVKMYNRIGYTLFSFEYLWR